MAEVLLVSGFLGAGKTTLLRHLLASQTSGLGKVAVLVNEFGEVGVDGTLLSGQDVDIVELKSGCICCTQTGAFRSALLEIRDRAAPDFLLIEASGVAQPAEMLDLLHEPSVLEFYSLRALVTVVDASFFEVREVLGPFYENQIRAADVVVLNKLDEVDEVCAADVETLVRAMHPGVRLLRARHCAVDLPDLLASVEGPDLAVASRAARGHDHRGWGFETFSYRETRPLDAARFAAFLETLPPTLFRLKGWVRFPDSGAFVELAGGQRSTKPTERPSETALAFVGRNCDGARLLSALSLCLSAPTPPGT